MNAPRPRFDPICTVAQIRAIEVAGIAQRAPGALMQAAGHAAAQRALALLGERGGRVLALAGPGNNGGDALVAARVLRASGVAVDVMMQGDAAKLPADAHAAALAWQATGGTLSAQWPGAAPALIIDGLFGIGLTRAMSGPTAALVESVNAQCAPVLALDIPSGLDADCGVVLGGAIRATETITFIARKPGLLTLDGPDLCGRIVVDSLGLDAWTPTDDLAVRGGLNHSMTSAHRAGSQQRTAALPATPGDWIDARVLQLVPPPRPGNFHKGNAGTLALVGGAAGMVGAALLAGRAAARLGAGKVLVGLLDRQGPSVDPLMPELMLVPVMRAIESASAIAVGPGCGLSFGAKRALEASLAQPCPLVIDADALNLIACSPALANQLAARLQPTLLTPHPAEAARLLGSATHIVQSDRIAAARAIAQRYNAHVILKGNGSVLCRPDGDYAINGSGNPGMASAGMGDVLSGMLLALLGQGLGAADAAYLATWLHGAAGDACAAQLGPFGFSASDVSLAARAQLARHYLGTATADTCQ